VWTGGSYADAINALAKVIFRKDGSGQLAGGKIFWDLAGKMNIGNFEIVNGAIVGYDTNGAERVRFSVEDIPAISAMVNSYVIASDEYTGSGFCEIESLYDEDGQFWYTQIIAGALDFTVQKTLIIPYATQLKVDNGDVDVSFQYPDNVSSYTVTKSVTVKNQSNVVVATGLAGQNLSIPSAGTYTVFINILVGVTLVDGEYTACSFQLSNTYARYIESVEKSFVGKDGLFSYFSSSEYIHFKKTQGLKVKGATDLPGVLAAGSVTTAGVASNTFGAKYSSTTRSTTGVFRVNHSIGSTNYTVQVTVHTSARLAYIGSKANDYVIINVTNTSGTLTDTAFDFLITGNN